MTSGPSTFHILEMLILTTEPTGTSIADIEYSSLCLEVTDGRVVRAGVSVT